MRQHRPHRLGEVALSMDKARTQVVVFFLLRSLPDIVVAVVRVFVESALNLAYSQDQAMSLLHNILGKVSAGDPGHPAASWQDSISAVLICKKVGKSGPEAVPESC